MVWRVLVVSLLLVGGLVAPAHAAPRDIRVCTVNIQNTPDLPDWKVRSDAREARRHCDLILWQEIRERADYRAIQGKGWRSTPRAKGGVPISWRTSVVRASGAARTVRVSDPTPRCPNGRPSYNPARWVTVQGFRGFTAVDLHFPNGAWGDPRRNCRQENRQARWWQAYRNTRAVLPAGRLVVGGDWNRRPESAVPRMVRLHWVSPSPRSVDHVFVARTGWVVRGRFVRELYSDHDLLGVRLVR
jgi:exonuclease III